MLLASSAEFIAVRRNIRGWSVCGLVVLMFLPRAPAAGIPENETLHAPTIQRIASIHAAGQRDGWLPQVAMLRGAATRAYERDRLQAAEAWYHVYRWATLLGQSEAEFVPRWIAAVNAAQVGHANMPARYTSRAQPLVSRLTPAFQLWLIGNAAFSAELFSLISPVDYVPRVFEILDELHRRDPARFKRFASLALAMALVYDVPPPPTWPHGQVTAEALPRRLPEPAEAFTWWTKQAQSGRLYHDLSRLDAAELKFVVDAAAPFEELEWSQLACKQGLGQMPAAYELVRYQKDRMTNNRPMWPGRTYTLSDIFQAGGICSDQAYFATQAGKARGVPTLLFHGPGNDGRHAWFGFLDGSQQWQLDAGRYAEQRFVTGFARDPQTWREFSDHELQFLTERFRQMPAFRQSRTHAAFAQEFLQFGKAPAAAVAARKAVNFERRNEAGWETLLAAARADGRDAKTLENILREAALAFQRYPDLEAAYVNRVAESLRARGETSAARAEVRRIAIKNQGVRADVSVRQARDIVQRAVATQPLAEQIRRYNSVVDIYGRGAGIDFFDEVVTGFAMHLSQLGQSAEALKAIERARRTLKVEPKSQLEGEFERLGKAVRSAK